MHVQNHLSRQQLEDANSWNKRNATFSFISPEQHDARNQKIRRILRKHGIDTRTLEPLDDDETKLLIDNEDSYFGIRDVLNFYEHYAVAVNTGLFEEDTAYFLDSAAVIRIFRRFEKLIYYVRNQVGIQEIYIDLEKLSLGWEAREKT